MSLEDPKWPQDEIECCQESDPIGFTAKKTWTSCNPYPPPNICRTGIGNGNSLISQAEADADALQKAKEHAARRLGIALSTPQNFLTRERAYSMIAPAGTRDINPPYIGRQVKKPWEYEVTVAIPHLNTLESLMVCIEILRHQTIKPYIIVIDTGSYPHVIDQLALIRSEDLEIHYLASNAYRHSSEPVARALDLAHAVCQTDLLFHTHSDCFLRRFDFVESLVQVCTEKAPVIGYRMSPRDWITNEWEKAVGHTATMIHNPTMLANGISWNMLRLEKEFGISLNNTGGWPDTETVFNKLLQRAGIKPVFIGYDQNYVRQMDDNIDHVRSYPGSRVYGSWNESDHQDWMKNAIDDALMRLVEKTLVNEKVKTIPKSISLAPAIA